MTILREAYHIGEVIVSIIGVGTVLEGLGWMRKWQRTYWENKVLDTFRSNSEDGPLQSANGVIGEIYLKAALKDASGFLPPRVKLNGWHAAAYWLRTSPYRLRHTVRRLMLPTKRKIERTLRDLWKQGLIVRPDFDHTKTNFYRLKN
jgi:hypothetical protein